MELICFVFLDPLVCISALVLNDNVSGSAAITVNLKVTVKMLKEVVGDIALSCARVFEWYKRFSEGREENEDEERPNRPVTARTDGKVLENT